MAFPGASHPGRPQHMGSAYPGFGKPVPLQKAEKLEYETGDRVRHQKFGDGTVLEILDKKKDYEVTVDFDTAGVKRMLAGFAKLVKL